MTKGGGGVSQKMTKDDKGGRGVIQKMTKDDGGGGGLETPKIG